MQKTPTYLIKFFKPNLLTSRNYTNKLASLTKTTILKVFNFKKNSVVSVPYSHSQMSLKTRKKWVYVSLIAQNIQVRKIIIRMRSEKNLKNLKNFTNFKLKEILLAKQSWCLLWYWQVFKKKVNDRQSKLTNHLAKYSVTKDLTKQVLSSSKISLESLTWQKFFSTNQTLRSVKFSYFFLGNKSSFYQKRSDPFSTSNYFDSTTTNITPQFNLILKKQSYLNHFLKLQWVPKVKNLWQYFMLTRFLSETTGLKVSILLNPFLENNLTFKENSLCLQWVTRLSSYSRLLGPQISLIESLKVLYLTLRLHEPSLISNWVKSTLKKINFWKYKLLIKYIKFLLNELFFTHFSKIKVIGVKFKIKGKVGVAGNSRTRSYLTRIGKTTQSTLKKKISYQYTNIHTFTGVIGFHFWIYF